ncbi:MAG: acyltransferase [Gammaproteobacteria bacterium]|nr:MAG: acyltransferase [Gammaproteobacteria bacterium]
MRIWKQASELAAQTPISRNRYVDFLRAASICIVIVGHWLMATVYYVDGELTTEHVFRVIPATQWLTWIFQVMPIFFIVGGYSNAVSLESARRKNIGYAGWLSTRLNRLSVPLLILILAWTLIALLMRLAGYEAATIQLITRVALIPTWFLAIYIMVVILAPAAYRVWQKFGFRLFWLLVSIAALMDWLYFAAEVRWPSWSSYFWVWLAIHCLGFAWRDSRLGSSRLLLVYSLLSISALAILVFVGPYPLAMIGSPDMTLSNTTPPKVTLVALSLFQFGLLLALENPMRRLLTNLRLWTATVLINGMIMSIYLWHVSVMVALIAVLYYSGGTGLGFEPGSGDWWLSRPLWIAALLLPLIPLALLLSPMERLSRAGDRRVLSPLRQVAGACLICLGIALLALFGYGGVPAWIDVVLFALVAVGAGIGGLLSHINR